MKIVATIPDDTHPPITYPFAITAASHNESTAQFLDFLKSPAAPEILEAQGFGVIAP